MSSSEHFCDLNRLHARPASRSVTPCLPLAHACLWLHFRGPRAAAVAPISLSGMLWAPCGQFSPGAVSRADQHHRGRVSCPPVLPHGDS